MAGPVSAAPPLHQTFAGCVGRMSAEMEHAWLRSDPAADQYQNQRVVFLSLLDATLPPGAERRALALRIEAKLAHAALLTTATFGTQARSAAQARARAEWHLSQCRALLLDS